MKSVYRNAGLPFAAQLLVVFLLPGTLAWSEAERRQDTIPRFRAESELVLVDLVATDGKGRFVSDIRQDEVEVLEDGKRQKIRLFRLEEGEIPAERPGDTSPGAARALRDVQERDQGGYVVFLLDLQTMDLDSAERSKGAIREFLHSGMDPGDLAMLVTIRPAFQVDQPFTGDLEK
ncbi:MAG: VWA domain-containing protein, partial [Candidatus Aminicenantes bacterium]|nr:VWA domain-containing protein [Candidatus Aminicenantes bacterium]